VSAWDELSEAARELICERSELDIAEDYVTLSARYDDVVAERDSAKAELAALHEGEEPYEDERLLPTPGQWIWLWNLATPSGRIAKAVQVLALHDRVDQCVMGFHERRVAELRELRQDWTAKVAELRAAEARIAAVRGLHRVSTLHDVVSGRFPYCVNCRFAWPCPTVAALDGPAEQPADDRQSASAEPGRNAEDCPACDGTNPPYPFLCPGHPADGPS